MNDTYGSTVRNAMKKSMEQPAQFKKLNQVQTDEVRASVLLVVFVAVLCAGIAGVYLLDRVEQPFRATATRPK